MGFRNRPRCKRWNWYLPGFLLVIALLTAFSTPVGQAVHAAQPGRVVLVKYRLTPVNVSHPRFKYLDTSRSSFVTGAWYDESNSYMIIGLNNTYYHYCRMPVSAWNSFRSADSFGRHYNAFIKGRHDCRLGGVPEYTDH
jgi:KTSC domain